MDSHADASAAVDALRIAPANSGLTRRARLRLHFNLTALGMRRAGAAPPSPRRSRPRSDLPTNPTAAAIARGLMVAVPIAVGLYAWHRRPDERFGPLLVAAGFGWFLTTLAESSDSLVYSIGRVSGWVVEIGLVWLILSFPSGRLTERVDRMLVQATAALVALLYLPDGPARRRLPGAGPVHELQLGLPGQRLLPVRLGARRRGRVLRARPRAADPDHLPRGHRARSRGA